MTSAVPADRNPTGPSNPGEPDSNPAPVATADAGAPPSEGEATTTSPSGGNPAALPTGPFRDARSPKDMTIAMLVLLVPILLIFGFYRIFLDGHEPATIDAGPVVAEARAAKVFPVVEPTGLGSDWYTVNASFRREAEGATLRIGFIAPSNGGVQLVQSSVPVARLFDTELTRTLRPEGTASIDGRDWQIYPARPGERALVLLEPGRTVIAVGAVSEQELRDLVDALG